MIEKNDGPFARHPQSLDFMSGHKVEPLIGGMKTFEMIEKTIVDAKESVHMAYWTLEPSRKTVGDISAQTIAELLRDTIVRGVTINILIADFDPVIGTTFHRGAWTAYRELMEITNDLDEETAKRLSVVCSRHDTRWGPLGRTAVQPILRYKLAEKVAAINALGSAEERRAFIRNVPGLWPFIRFDGEKASTRPAAYPGFYPAAHHEKLCVIDDTIVFLGGLDMTEKRMDDWTHQNAFPWHDIACRLEGPAAKFFAGHFRCRWNEELGDCEAFLRSAKAPGDIEALPGSSRIPRLGLDVPDPDATADGIDVKPLRTMSKQSRAWFSRSPRSQITEIRQAYLDVIAQAEDFLYIENQYIRSTAIAEALARRAGEASELEVILVLPLMPEDAFVEDEPNIATRHGQYLREKNTDLLIDAFGKRIGIFSMQMPHNDRLPDPETAEPEEIIANTVYIHAKTLVCDDKVAIIGSANLNDRSLVMDTETAIEWRGGTSVRDYRVELWRHALDIDTSDWTADHLAKWRKIARANTKGAPGERSGFIVPFPRRHLDAHARYSWLVPDELV